MCSASSAAEGKACAETSHAVVDRRGTAGNSLPEPNHQTQDQAPGNNDIGQEMCTEENPVERDEE